MLSSYTFSCTLDPNGLGGNGATHSQSKTRMQIWQERRTILELEDEVPSYKKCLDELLKGGVTPNYKRYAQPLPNILDKNPFWERVSWATRPEGGGIPAERRERKIQQVENMVVPARAIIEYALARRDKRKRLKVVEFCGGSGYVLLPLAQLYPHVDFVLVDCKAKSIQIARKRIAAASLKENVQVIEGRIQDYREGFDVGIALHACGALSDIVLELCMDSRAGFVVCPCCIGKISFMHKLPRSKRVSAALSASSAPTLWTSLLKAADFGHAGQTWYTPRNRDRRVCKAIVEEDRRLLCEERGFTTSLLIMTPSSASPKSDVLVGWPRYVGEAGERPPDQAMTESPQAPSLSPFHGELELVEAFEPTETLPDFLFRQMFPAVKSPSMGSRLR
jgi:hypothetical protein